MKLHEILDKAQKEKGLDGLKALFISDVQPFESGGYVGEDVIFDRRIKINLDDYRVYEGVRVRGGVVYVRKNYGG